MTRPRLLDLFGGEGLAAYGYALAGFDVTSIEILDHIGADLAAAA